MRAGVFVVERRAIINLPPSLFSVSCSVSATCPSATLGIARKLATAIPHRELCAFGCSIVEQSSMQNTARIRPICSRMIAANVGPIVVCLPSLTRLFPLSSACVTLCRLQPVHPAALSISRGELPIRGNRSGNVTSCLSSSTHHSRIARGWAAAATIRSRPVNRSAREAIELTSAAVQHAQ